MSRIGIYSHTPSEAVRNLNDSLQIANFSSRILLRRGASSFRARSDDFVINYGASDSQEISAITHEGKVINTSDAVRMAANKERAFIAMSAADVKVVKFTTSRTTARNWVESGDLVYCRSELNGHSGAGISLCATGAAPGDLGDVPFYSRALLPRVPLYTVGIPGRYREMRVHVAFGEVILEQQKRRRDGYRELENYSNVVRNFDRGWVYSPNEVTTSDAVRAEAIKAVKALRLDFGAVDIITQGTEFWILEVNTAPGLSGESSRAAYCQAFQSFFNGTSTYRLQTELDAVAASTAATAALLDSTIVDLETSGEIGASWTNTDSWNPSDFRQTEEVEPWEEDEDGEDDEGNRGFIPPRSLGSPSRLSARNPFITDLLRTMEEEVSSLPSMPEQTRRVAPTSNPMDSQADTATSETPTTPALGLGHYVVQIDVGVNTVVYVGPGGEAYTSEYDMVLPTDSYTFVSRIDV